MMYVSKYEYVRGTNCCELQLHSSHVTCVCRTCVCMFAYEMVVGGVCGGGV